MSRCTVQQCSYDAVMQSDKCNRTCISSRCRIGTARALHRAGTAPATFRRQSRLAALCDVSLAAAVADSASHCHSYCLPTSLQSPSGAAVRWRSALPAHVSLVVVLCDQEHAADCALDQLPAEPEQLTCCLIADASHAAWRLVQ